MKTRLLILLLAFATTALAESDPDKTLSPYFLVKSGSTEVEEFPLERTETKVSIAGVIADVHVSQTYKNGGQEPIEAIYVFPASTRAAVHAMRMRIGDRLIEAQIKEKQAAKATYEKAKREGKSASLLEQQRPNVFQMNVANIMPGDKIEVDLEYTELLVPTDGTYEFVYPTVVGPRYSNIPAAAETAANGWIRSPYTHQGEPPANTFAIHVDLMAGMPIRDVSSSSHRVAATFATDSHAQIGLDSSEKQGGDRDFVLHYRLSGEQVQTGTLLFEGGEENFFLTMVQPPKRIAPEQILPREYIFIVDVSGSMYGFPIDTAKTLLRNLLGGLSPRDSFNILLFAGGSEVLSDTSLAATPENLARAVTLLDAQRGGGSTELLPALKRALALPRNENISRTVVLVSDGYVTVEAEAFDLIRNNLNQANLFAFGIGTGVNRFLIEGLARIGKGEPFVVLSSGQAQFTAERFRKYIETPLLRNVRVEFNGFEAYDVEPISVPDMFASRPLVIFGKFRGKPKGSIGVRAISSSGDFYRELPVAEAENSKQLTALRFLWARERIARLGDYQGLSGGEKSKAEITALGIKYNLLTAYTSFVAVDKVVRNPNGNSKLVKQPLPLPKGVSDLAVGGTLGTTPEPETYLLLLIAVLLLMLGARTSRSAVIQPARCR